MPTVSLVTGRKTSSLTGCTSAPGGASVTVGVAIFPYHPLLGKVLIAAGIGLEIQGVREFIDWAQRYGQWLNEVQQCRFEDIGGL